MSKVDLLVAPCSYEAAKYAVMNWHYSGTVPAGKIVKCGVWENGVFIGAVLFGRGANNNIGKPYGLKQIQVCELVRVALSRHESPVSKIVTLAIKLLKGQAIRLIVSYADPEENHTGIIYQAMNWLYVGTSKPQREALGLNGEIVHKRSAYSKFGTLSGQNYSKILFKHKYLYPLDKAMRRQIEPLAKPYPKRAPIVQNGNTGDDQSSNGGSIPT